MAFVREKDHWLFRFSPEEWVFAGLGEVKRAETAYARGDSRGGLAGARRAAGMALNGVLVLDAYGHVTDANPASPGLAVA